MPIARHQGRAISFVDAGSGTPIVLLPPGASPAAAWRQAADTLSRRFRTIAINPSGYGDTDPFVAERPMSLDDEATAALAVISEVGSPVHLVGHSYGGAIAIRLALEWPDHVLTLTLLEPAVYPLLAEFGETALAQEVEEVNRTFIERARAGETEAAFRSYVNYYNGDDGAWSALTERSRAQLRSLADVVATALEAAHDCPTCRRDFASISMPTLLVRGDDTDRVHACLTDSLAREIPSARLEIVEGAGHMLSVTHPDAVAGLILRHADRL